MQSYFDQYIQAGGVMMFVLIPLSALTLGFILQGFISLRPSRIVPQGLVDAAKGVTTPTDYAAFRQGLPSLPHILARVTLGYLEAAEKGELDEVLTKALVDGLYAGQFDDVGTDAEYHDGIIRNVPPSSIVSCRSPRSEVPRRPPAPQLRGRC